MTIPRSDNPTPIEFGDIHAGDTIEIRTAGESVDRSDRFVVAEKRGGLLVPAGWELGGYAPSPVTAFLLHHRPVALPAKPVFGRLTWTDKRDQDYAVCADWHWAHRFGSENGPYAMSGLGHAVPLSRATKWEPGTFVSADTIEAFAEAVQTDEEKVSTRRDSNSTIVLQQFFLRLGGAS